MIEVKISSNQMESILRIYVNKAKEGEKTVFSPKKEEEGEGDKVFLSRTGEKMGKLQQQYKKIPDIRADLVRELKVKIEKGEYEVRGREVAEKMFAREIADFLINGGKDI